MKTQEYYSLNRASRVLKADRDLITFLVRWQRIPVQWVGSAKCLDVDGFQALKQALDDYRLLPDAVRA